MIKLGKTVNRCASGKSRLLVFVPILAAAAVGGWLLTHACPSAVQARHVVLISIDTCRPDYLSCYGFNRPTTPNIDKLAAESILFTNAISPVPITLPAHASMLTGTIPPYHGVHDNMDYRLSQGQVTLAELLRQNGYTTGAIISAFVMDSQFDLDQGFDHYDDTFMASRTTIGINERRGDETSQLAVQWLDEHKDEDSFLFLHYYDPHASYDPPQPFAARFADDLYAGEIAFVDHCIGLVIDKLKDLGLYDSTLIVITGDHGEMLGEHGEDTHAYFIYQSALRVPLIFKVPGAGAASIDDGVGLIDIFPTICSTLGIETPEHGQGEDLTGYFSNTGARRERVFYCESFTPTKYYDAAGLLGIIVGGWKYIHTARPELYDLINDPHELNDLAAEQPARVDTCRRQLDETLQSTVLEDDSDSMVALDAESLARIESLGYVGGSVSKDFRLDQNHNKLDPKDLIEFHTVWGRVRVDQVAGTEYANESPVSPAQYDEDKAICQELIRRYPRFFTPHLCLGSIAMIENDDPAAVSHLRDALRLQPDEFQSHALLGRSLGRLEQFDEAIEHLERAITLKSNRPMPHNTLGTIYAQLGNIDLALEHFEHALAIDSKSHYTYRNLGKVYFQQGDHEKAIQYYRQSLQINPDQPGAHNGLSQILYAQGDIQGAVAALTTAVRLSPDWPAALNNLARIKATSTDDQIRDPQEAIRLAERACKQTGFQNVKFLVTLAQAHAAASSFAEAIETAQSALDLAQAAGHTKNATQIQQYIEHYRISLANLRHPE